ncbi:hypothetical protein [Helicoverpa armigera nucleopolyhedrovirus]|nr:hypothetical protein [Helicoverpa armigera nucleopolyhedrovirus]
MCNVWPVVNRVLCKLVMQNLSKIYGNIQFLYLMGNKPKEIQEEQANFNELYYKFKVFRSQLPDMNCETFAHKLIDQKILYCREIHNLYLNFLYCFYKQYFDTLKIDCNIFKDLIDDDVPLQDFEELNVVLLDNNIAMYTALCDDVFEKKTIIQDIEYVMNKICVEGAYVPFQEEILQYQIFLQEYEDFCRRVENL